MNSAHTTASAAMPAPTQKGTLKLCSNAGALVHVAEAGAAGNRLLNGQHHLDARDLTHLGGHELGRAHDPVLRLGQFVGHGGRGGGHGDPHAEARQTQGDEDDDKPDEGPSVANRIMEIRREQVPTSVAVRSPVRIAM